MSPVRDAVFVHCSMTTYSLYLWIIVKADFWWAGLDMGGGQLRQGSAARPKEASSTAQAEQLPLQREAFQRPASEAPHVSIASSIRQLEALQPIKCSASADDMPAGTPEDVSHLRCFSHHIIRCTHLTM